MANPFLFDTEFREPAAAKPQKRVVDEARAEETRAAAEAAGYQQGRRAGLAEAKHAAEARTAEAMERIAAACTGLIGTLDETRARLERDATEVAVATARKLAPALVGSEPIIEVAALAARCLGSLREAPHVVVRLRAEEADLARIMLERLARDRGFEGRLVVMGEPDIAAGDCRIEWADGGFVRDMKAIEAEIEAGVARYLAGRKDRKIAP